MKVEGYGNYVKKLGQWHLTDHSPRALCGMPLLGNNYAEYYAEHQHELKLCERCFAEAVKRKEED